MTPERAAAVARTEREIAERFEAYELADAGAKAAALIRWLQRLGWRVHPELAAGSPPRPVPASAAAREAAKKHLADALAARPIEESS